MKQLTLRLDTSFRNRESKYFDSLVGQIENPDRLSASEAEKKRAALMAFWKSQSGKEGEGGGRPCPAIENLVNSKMDNRLQAALGNPPREHA